MTCLYLQPTFRPKHSIPSRSPSKPYSTQWNATQVFLLTHSSAVEICFGFRDKNMSNNAIACGRELLTVSAPPSVKNSHASTHGQFKAVSKSAANERRRPHHHPHADATVRMAPIIPSTTHALSCSVIPLCFINACLECVCCMVSDVSNALGLLHTLPLTRFMAPIYTLFQSLDLLPSIGLYSLSVSVEISPK